MASSDTLGIYDKNDSWLNEHCLCGHVRYFHKPGREQGTLGCTCCSCERFKERSVASSDTLREQVAEVVRENSPCRIVMGGWPERTADAAIWVVLAAVAEQIEQVRDEWSGGGMFNTSELDEALAVVARLGGAVSDGK